MDTFEPILPSLARLYVYRKALALLRLVKQLPASGSLRGQMFAAAESVAGNIAEGAGQVTLAAKRRHYTIARGSLFETGSAIDALRLEHDIDVSEIAPLMCAIERMLTALIRR